MTTGSRPTDLVLMPILKAHRTEQGRLVVTQKYVDGANEYAKSWPGTVISLFKLSDKPSSDMDHVEVDGQDGSHRIELLPRSPAELAERLKSAALVVGSLSPQEKSTTDLCNRIGVPVVQVSEYTLKTEWQIIDAQVANPIVAMRRKQWAWKTERVRRRLIKLSAGLQCNGTPTFDAYRPICPEAFLYFDNRVREMDVITPQELRRKAEQLRQGAPLRLVFGGRFVPMKGALYLPEVARELRDHGVPFQLAIYGTGPDEPALRSAIERYALQDHVTIHAPIDFRSGWVPFLKEVPDLFVCCHPQGDPSSTYSEVSSCGVPIAGFDNEAFCGFQRLSGAGFLAPMKDAGKLAQVIAELHADRERLAIAAQKARAFAIQHSFEATFKRRTENYICKSLLTKT
ncbi:hypothetical protein XM53_18890 [Roseovarius atlanticus]|uniref:Glycosyl transferase family 1 domain-containing protein n=1 Tax=Roseovarius atlanticus TaxID=1641875 RepID=A0A0T5NPV7_9RHOB|nr:glycosyltransferase [Roseovarius atlanticus]KRS10812.1 hypothetical protein XM53_18890 [Roseovarius atlanticus]